MTKEKKIKNSTIDQEEHDKFYKMAEEWWDPNGKFKTLHKFNPVRIAFIREKIITHFNINPKNKNPFNKIKLLDVRCGASIGTEVASQHKTCPPFELSRMLREKNLVPWENTVAVDQCNLSRRCVGNCDHERIMQICQG